MIIFASIITAERLDPREFGLSKGEVLEVQDNGITCFGPEYQFDARVLLDIYKDFDITISTTYLSGQLETGDNAMFIYWGRKRDIKTPIQTIDDPMQYNSTVQIALLGTSKNCLSEP